MIFFAPMVFFKLFMYYYLLVFKDNQRVYCFLAIKFVFTIFVTTVFHKKKNLKTGKCK